MTTRYIFVPVPGSRNGELHRERAGLVKIIARAYLNQEGWLIYGNGSWLPPGTFRVVPARTPRVRHVLLDRVVDEALQHARRLLGAGVPRLRKAAPEIDSHAGTYSNQKRAVP